MQMFWHTENVLLKMHAHVLKCITYYSTNNIGPFYIIPDIMQYTIHLSNKDRSIYQMTKILMRTYS